MIRNSTWKYDRKKLTIKINTDFEKWKLIYQMNIISVVFIRMFEDKIFCLNGWMFRGVLDKIIKIVYKILLWYNELIYQLFYAIKPFQTNIWYIEHIICIWKLSFLLKFVLTIFCVSLTPYFYTKGGTRFIPFKEV